jgi:hypothetical protein
MERVEPSPRATLDVALARETPRQVSRHRTSWLSPTGDSSRL